MRYLQKYLYGMKNKASILLNYFLLTIYNTDLKKAKVKSIEERQEIDMCMRFKPTQ